MHQFFLYIPGLSSYTVYLHYQGLREKGTSNLKIGSGRKIIFESWFKKKAYSKADKK